MWIHVQACNLYATLLAFKNFFYLNVILCVVFPELSLHPLGVCALGVIGVGLVSADQALLDPSLLSVTTSWVTYSISPSLLSHLQIRGNNTSLSGFLRGWRLDTSVRPLEWWLAQMGPSAHGLHHKATLQLPCQVFPDVAFSRASCWQWRWIFQSVTTGHLPMPGPSWASPGWAGRAHQKPVVWLIHCLRHVRAETSLCGVYCQSCQTRSVSRNDSLPLPTAGSLEPVGSQQHTRFHEAQSGCLQGVECCWELYINLGKFRFISHRSQLDGNQNYRMLQRTLIIFRCWEFFSKRQQKKIQGHQPVFSHTIGL